MGYLPAGGPGGAAGLRASLVEDGYCIVPGVCPPELLGRLQAWSDTLLDDPSHPPW